MIAQMMKQVDPEEFVSGVTVPKPSVLRFVSLVVLPLIVLTVAVLAFVFLTKTKPQVAKRAPQERVWTVSGTQAVLTDLKPVLKLFGQATSGRRVELRALVSGEIRTTGEGFREGGEVSKGDVLLELDTFEFETLLIEAQANLDESSAKLMEQEARVGLEESQLDEARRQLVLAQTDLTRARPLRKQGLLSQKSVDDRQVVVSQREQAVRQRQSSIAIEKARVEQNRAAIARLENAVRWAQRNLNDTRLVAPFDGYVGALNAEVGRKVSVNDAVAVLIDRDRVDVKFNLSDAQYGRLVTEEGSVIGRKVRVVWRAGDTVLEYQAVVERVGAEVSAASGGVEIYARVKTSDNKVPLRVGSFVEVYVDDRIFRNVVRLPETALYTGDRIYVISEGRLAERKVTLAGYAGRDILVRGDLAAGEQVLTTRISEIGSGLKVEVR